MIRLVSKPSWSIYTLQIRNCKEKHERLMKIEKDANTLYLVKLTSHPIVNESTELLPTKLAKTAKLGQAKSVYLSILGNRRLGLAANVPKEPDSIRPPAGSVGLQKILTSGLIRVSYVSWHHSSDQLSPRVSGRLAPRLDRYA